MIGPMNRTLAPIVAALLLSLAIPASAAITPPVRLAGTATPKVSVPPQQPSDEKAPDAAKLIENTGKREVKKVNFTIVLPESPKS